MTTPMTENGCGDADVLALCLTNGSHGDRFQGETCLVEKANRIAFCIPEFRERFGAPERFSDDHPSISRVVRSMAIGLNDLAWESDDARTAAWATLAPTSLALRASAIELLDAMIRVGQVDA